MIGKEMAKMLLENQESFLIPAERVAHIQMTNRLDHALLVLTKIGYNVIPVLDTEYKLRGLISMPMIIDAITGIENLNFDKLGDIRVEEVMQTDFPVIDNPYELEEVLHLLVRYSFVCVASDDGSFTGIVTRSEILKATNRIAHEFENKYEVKRKIECV
ncbi:CBS domain-containing protein [Carnobacterium sp. CS13]|nr:cyclic-di-AMP-binding protein CbpB [Carnobacterium sp. CS13]ALV22911.1 Inosine-5'-monophosphate dehydrogenase [Carnobacterium sp. CP1]QQP70801.1 CBS domain-containing protein [Carnobacterium sp. CS13]